jgi:hypothetical protein
MPVLLGEALSELAWDMELSLSVLQWLSRPCQFALRSLTSTAKLPPFAVRANDSKKKSRGCESAPFDFDEREAPTIRCENFSQEGKTMRKILMTVAMVGGMMTAGSGARAQVDLSTYADPEGFLDVQTLTCAQLAGTWQDQADLLASWYSGWYNGLAKKHYMDIRKGKEAEHEVIVYCKANPQLKIIQAMDVVFKSMRERTGIKVQ